MSNEIKVSKTIVTPLTLTGSSGDAIYVYVGGNSKLTADQKLEIMSRVNNHDCLVHQLNDRTIAINVANKANAKLTQENARLTGIIAGQDKVIGELGNLAYELVSTLKSIGNDCGAEDTKEFVDNLLSKINNEGSDNE